ncbi:MAG: nitroreductase family protein [Deltaproteobacteria bacterium]|nr:nitroreductase family protein [Deltaproteobacteria bacterium]
MGIKTARTEESAVVLIDRKECSDCGLCAGVCKGGVLTINEKRVLVAADTALGGCFGCGQCMAVCPNRCIEVTGRDLSPGDMIHLPEKEDRASWEELQNLMLSRRSVRDFADKEIPDEILNKVLDAAAAAPMGIPPTDLEVLCISGRQNVRTFAFDLIEMMDKSKWMLYPLTIAPMRFLMGKETSEVMSKFILPVIKVLKEKMRAGEDWLFYGAPTVLFFHTSPYADPQDPAIAATFSMLAAQSLGLGTCMIGTVGPFLKYSNELKKKYGISKRNQMGVALIMGYPRIKYHRAIKRRLAGIHRH